MTINIDCKIDSPKIREFKSVLLTGSTSGIGYQLLINFLSVGTKCIVLARNPLCLEKELKHFGKLLEVVTCDLLDTDSLQEIIKSISKKNFDLFIHSAGLCNDLGLKCIELDSKIWINEISVNTISALQIISVLLNQGGKNTIMCGISSHSGLIRNQQTPGLIIYKTSKVALNMMFLTLASEYPDIIFISLAPGQFRSKMSPFAKDISHEKAKKIIYLLERCGLIHSGGCFDIEGQNVI